MFFSGIFKVWNFSHQRLTDILQELWPWLVLLVSWSSWCLFFHQKRLGMENQEGGWGTNIVCWEICWEPKQQKLGQCLITCTALYCISQRTIVLAVNPLSAMTYSSVRFFSFDFASCIFSCLFLSILFFNSFFSLESRNKKMCCTSHMQ